VLSTVYGLVAIVAFVLPGFIASRVATRDRPAPATLTDLELILRALFYALVIHLIIAGTGWTSNLVDDLNGGRDWNDHIGELALFGLAVVGSAIALGQLLHLAFEVLAPRTSWPARLAFHALGGQDVRDGFDYIFLRRKRQKQPFIVVVDADGGERVAGVYGDASYFGFSPRPHDLYLEEIWDIQGENFVRRQEGDRFGAWFRAEAIERLEFRDLREEEESRGSARRFGTRIREAMRETRENIAKKLVEAAGDHQRAPTDQALQEAVGQLTGRVTRFVNDTKADYEGAQLLKRELVEVGTLAARKLREEEQEDFANELLLIRELGRAAERARHSTYPWGLWALTLDFWAEQLDETSDREGYLLMIGGLVIAAIVSIDDWNWEEIYEGRERAEQD
jgi:hypothetical protein